VSDVVEFGRKRLGIVERLARLIAGRNPADVRCTLLQRLDGPGPAIVVALPDGRVAELLIDIEDCDELLELHRPIEAP
jgi:hypothetical protein